MSHAVQFQSMNFISLSAIYPVIYIKSSILNKLIWKVVILAITLDNLALGYPENKQNSVDSFDSISFCS